MRKLYVFFLAAAITGVTGISGCNIINPEEPVPTYIHIDSFAFDNSSPRGSSSRNITHVWAYVDNQPVGNFDLPATFPVLLQASSELTVLPGIDFDGLRGYAVTYPMYSGPSMTVSPKPGETINWTPVTSYLPGTQVLFNETFDDAGTIRFKRRSGFADLQRTTTDVLEGGGAGIIELNEAGKDSMTVLSDTISLTAGRAAYVEVDFKGNMPLTVGMRAYRDDGQVYDEYIISFFEQAKWKKFYVGVREFVGANIGTRYQVILGARRPDGQSSGTIRVDNVKVVSF